VRGANVSLSREEYKKRFAALCAAEKIDVPNISEHVDRAINLGLSDFWGAHPWSFKQYEYSLSCAISAETYELPDKFESFRIAREEETNLGSRLIYKTKEQFDALVPKLSWHATDTPQMYTAYKDADKDKWYVRFWPQPAGGETIPLSLYMDTPDDVSRVPNRFHSTLDACIARHVYPYGHPGFMGVEAAAELRLKKAKYRDKVNQSKMTVMPDDTSQQLNTKRPWT
jgi:hypothetical protein